MFPQTNPSWSGCRYCNITVRPLAAWTSLTPSTSLRTMLWTMPQATASYGLSTLIGPSIRRSAPPCAGKAFLHEYFQNQSIPWPGRIRAIPGCLPSVYESGNVVVFRYLTWTPRDDQADRNAFPRNVRRAFRHSSGGGAVPG